MTNHQSPFFSIITCTYNSQNYIEKNILSVEKQLFKNYEHIFIDGASSDKTVKLILDYRKDFPERVKLYSRMPKGISNAFNEGIRVARGKYLIHLNSDDSFYNNKVLQNAFNYLNSNKKLDWIYGKSCVISEEGKSLGTFPDKSIFQNNSFSALGKYILKFINYIPHQAVFIKKNIFDKYGYFDESLSSKMDPDMWIRIKEDTQWSYFDCIVSNYMLRKGAMSSSKINIPVNKANLEIVQKRYLNRFEYIIAVLINRLYTIKNRDLIK